MRHLLLVAAVACTVVSANFLEKAQGLLSGAASVNASAAISSGGTGALNFWQGIQNSSFGQAVQGGIDYYNQVKNGNSSFNIDTDSIQKTIANSSFGEVVQSGVEFYNNLKNGNSKFSGNASDVVSQFVPFLANASTEAQTEFYAILPNVGNMTIAEFEAAVDAWAAKYGLAADVDAFQARSENATRAAEEHANAVVMNLPNVLNNMKAIGSDKNQTVEQMHSRIINYVVSLDDDTRDIVIVLFSSLLPPQFKQVKCTGGNFLTNIYTKAAEFFGGGGNNGTSSGSFWGGASGSGGSSGSFWGGASGSGGSSGSFWGGNGSGPKIGILTKFMNNNNLSDADVSNIVQGGVQGGAQGDMASIQILPFTNLQVEGNVDVEAAVTKKNKKQQQKANKNKKKTTTVSPAVVDPNVNLEVHAQIL